MFSLALGAVLLALSLPAEALQSRIHRVRFLFSFGGDPTEHPILKGFREGLREAGYIEGKNLVLDMALKKAEDLRIIAKSWNYGNTDVIATIGNTETAIAKQETKGIPIVFMPTTDPVRSGFVKSLSRPQTNLTGLTYDVVLAIHGKQLEVFKESLPNLSRVVVLYDARGVDQFQTATMSVVRKTAGYLALKLTEQPITSISEGEEAISLLSRETTDGIFIICTSLFADLRRINAVSRQRRIPLFGCRADHVANHGGLVTYAPDFFYMGRRGAWYVDRVLKGARPQDLPVETPRKFELVINLKTADAIGIKIPPEVLQRADKVIR
jgi:putative tryptophan/tyrosine transport system substrate-binding protein